MYTKIRAHQLFDGYNFRGEDEVLILNKSIVEDFVRADDAGDDVQFYEGMITPGFVNSHCHTELCHMRNTINRHSGLVQFLQQIVLQRTECDDIHTPIRKSIDYMYETGTVAVGDICNTTDSLAYKDNRIHWQNFIEASGFVEATAQRKFAEAKKVKQQFLNAGMIATIVPHAPYSVSKKLFELIKEESEGELISIHNQECAAENELFLNGTGEMLTLYKNLGIDIGGFTYSGRTSFQSWLPFFTSNRKISVHNTFITEDDIDAATDIYYCICIKANFYIENKVPPVDMLFKKGAKIIIGTDSLASNDVLDMWNEVKMIHEHFPSIPLVQILNWATFAGAEALGINDRFGSFEKGKSPGVVFIKDDVAKRIA